MKRSGLPARVAEAGKSKPGFGALCSLLARNRLSLDATNLLHLSCQLVSSPQTGWGQSMCEFCRNGYRATRRNALTLAASALASGLMGRAALAANDKTPPKPQNVISPDAALDRLTKGNARYVKGTTLRHDFAHEREALSTGQNPFAAILKLRRFAHRSRTLLRHGAWRPVCLPHRRQFRQRRNGGQPGIRCAGA